jgi:hypothetical protein
MIPILLIKNNWTGNILDGLNGNPLIDKNILYFSWKPTTIQSLRINLPGYSSYTLYFDIQTFAYGTGGKGGYLQINIDFRNKEGGIVGSLVYGNISQQIPAYTTKTTIAEPARTNMSSATYCEIKIQGKDNANWAGIYGPQISNMYLIPSLINLLNNNFIQSEWQNSAFGITGGARITNNTLEFSYLPSTLSRTISNLPKSPTYTLSFDVQTDPAGGRLEIVIMFYNTTKSSYIGKLTYGDINVPIIFPTKTRITQRTGATQNMSLATFCEIKITGRDTLNWIGFYGPKISNISLTI